jgi:small subunit ribosomal protein S21
VSQIVIREGDSFEVALKRFARKVQQDGILSEARRRQRYEPPSMRRKRQAKMAARGY